MVLPLFDYNNRISRLREALVGHVEAIIITKAENIRWLTGFKASSGAVFVTPDSVTLITDGRYELVGAQALSAGNVEAALQISSDLASIFGRLGKNIASIGLEANDVTWAFVTEAQERWFSNQKIVATTDMVEGLRAIKEPAEVACIVEAAAIADSALAMVLPLLGMQHTEVEIAQALERAMREAGSPQPAFSTIVAAGTNSALPHHEPSNYTITRGDLVVVDMGATCHGYCSDMTRTFSIGEASVEKKRMLEVVNNAHRSSIAMAKPGVPTREVDGRARQIISDAGWSEFFVHPTGHGLGLEIHEPLRLSTTSNATLRKGHVVTVEPGVYIPGTGGVRIEDTIEITLNGSRMLTRSDLPTVID